jgi:predicted nucleic acid-binding protein
MTLADVAAGDSVFIDANTLIYHCTLDPAHGPSCTDFLDRVGRGEVAGFVSTHVLAEVAHRLMVLEAAKALAKPQGSMVKYLKKHPAEIQRLTGFRQAVTDLCASNLTILTTPGHLIPTMTALSQQFGLLTNDALIVAVMQAQGLSKIASNDPDFDRVTWLTRYAPA